MQNPCTEPTHTNRTVLPKPWCSLDLKWEPRGKNNIHVSGAMKTNPTKIHEGTGSIPGLAPWFRDPAYRELWYRPQTQLRSCMEGDPALLWLWYKRAAAAPIPPLAWELPYAVSGALKKQTNKTNIHIK